MAALFRSAQQNMKHREIEENARFIRQCFEAFSANVRNDPFHPISAFPAHFCQNGSRILLKIFHEILGYKREKLSLIVNASNREFGTHAWARVDSFDVDVTADQFGVYPAIIVEDRSRLRIDFSEPNEIPYIEAQRISEDWKAQFQDPIIDFVMTEYRKEGRIK